MCLPSKPDLSAQKAEAAQQAAAEQDKRSRDKKDRLNARRGSRSGSQFQSLAGFSAPSSGGRSFFAPTGG